ncbi:unnamed protein product [Rotaria socialis]|uniref:Caspase family p20 domain-containing protein n=2 Tax=Rotaria socialis TaxID=392032 RepID=A0A821NXZ6_9BILA|nr:unnamed protein product [Rotaria socialis]
MAVSNKNLSSPRKLALIIGNQKYQSENKQRYAINNATDFSNVLESINFTTTKACDISKQDMASQIVDFRNKINDGDLILFYFSGHVYQANGKTYLIPTNDSNIEKECDFDDFAINFEGTVKRLVEKNPSFVTIFLLDYCSPYVLMNGSAAKLKTNGKGLSEIQPPPGTFIQFACSANQTSLAVLGANRNSLYTKHLLQNITEENVPISDLFRRVRNAVHQESNQRQIPLSMDGLRQHKQASLNEVIVARLRTQDFLSKEPLSQSEYRYYERCKEYYRGTGKPLVSVASEVLDNSIGLTSSILKFGIDDNYCNFDVQDFLTTFCEKMPLKMDDIVVKGIQAGSVIMTVAITGETKSNDKKRCLQLVYKSFTDSLQDELGKMKTFFIFMGPEESLLKIQKYQEKLYLHPEFNRVYVRGRDFWQGALSDGKGRGSPYYCPVGWKRWSFYVTDRFDEKFNGWCICYHGTKFAYGISILLNGLKPAYRHEHGAGIYVTPSINYASHPRYAEVKQIPSSFRNTFKLGDYIQYVLECRVHPNSIKKIVLETLRCKNNVRIDPNIENERLEWVIDTYKKTIVDFNDPESPIVCTGLMIRVTQDHPGLLPESQWWFASHLCESENCCKAGIELSILTRKLQRGSTCSIIYD